MLQKNKRRGEGKNGQQQYNNNDKENRKQNAEQDIKEKERVDMKGMEIGKELEWIDQKSEGKRGQENEED